MQKQTSLTRELLSALTVVSEVVGSSPVTNPRVLTRMLMQQMFAPAYPKRTVGITLARLKYRRYIEERDGVITLTPKGQQRAKSLKLQSLVLDTTQPWDGRWRLVIWDVPEVRRRERDLVRQILKKLGFVRIQRSIWVSPHPCRDEIAFLREELGLHVGLVYLESDFIEDQGRLRRYFHLLTPTVEE
ncbi:CRISPR-associated endonuclease Cas2 [Candidatus Berkelbacteria bacterium]|nr:CRISPR-associated endonuclease Cas2 [Candidatus Berkelbacteria bacterium]